MLVAHEHSIVRSAIRALLEREEDMEVVGAASSGEEAIEMTDGLHANVVLMSISMPLIDGLHATRRIKRGDPEARVLILGEHEGESFSLSSIKSGASGYVAMTATPFDLLLAIRSISRGERLLPVTTYCSGKACKDQYDRLTKSQRELVRYLADGYSRTELAHLFSTTVRSVDRRRRRVMARLGVQSRAELIKYAIRKGLIAVDG